jgi:hypothetical protein
MPICVNPKCGQISKTMSLYCPSCGQKSLSRIDRGQVEGPHSTEISMENFDRITKDVPAKSEKPYSRSKSKKHIRNYTKNQRMGKAASVGQQNQFSAVFSLVSLILGVISITIGLADLAAIDQGKFLYLQDSEITLLLALNLGSTGMAIAAYLRRQPYWRGAFSIAFMSILVFIACLQYDFASVFGM